MKLRASSSRKASAGCLPAEISQAGGITPPACDLFEFRTPADLSRVELTRFAESLGTQWADALITDPRWPSCNQAAAIVAAGAVVDRTASEIANILDGIAFAPHAAAMSATMRSAFWDSMPPLTAVGQRAL
jgi:hypothetical protein